LDKHITHIAYINTYRQIPLNVLLTSADHSDALEDRRVGNVHLCCHLSTRRYSWYWYLAVVNCVLTYNLMQFAIRRINTKLFLLNPGKD